MKNMIEWSYRLFKNNLDLKTRWKRFTSFKKQMHTFYELDSTIFQIVPSRYYVVPTR